MTRIGALAILCLLLVGVIAGCGGSSSSGSSTAGGTSTGVSTEAESSKQVNLAMVETFSTVPFYVYAKEGAEAAAKNLDVNLTVQAPTVTNGTNEATMASNLLAEEPEGFAPDPCILPAWTRVLKEMAEKVPNENVVVWNCSPISEPDQTPPIKTFVGVNDRETGRMAAKLAIEEAGLSESTTGTALLAACQEGVAILDHRREGEEETVEEMMPKVKIVTFASSDDEQAKNSATWSSELTSHPETVLAMGPCDTDSASLLTIKQKTGGTYAVSSYDPSAAEIKSIKEGVFTSAVSTEPWTVAYTTIALLAQGARGGSLPDGWVNTGALPITKKNYPEFLKAVESEAGAEALYRPQAEKALKEAAAQVKPLSAQFE